MDFDSGLTISAFEAEADPEERAKPARYGIPQDKALGIAMGAIRKRCFIWHRGATRYVSTTRQPLFS